MKKTYFIFVLFLLPVASGFAQQSHGAIFYNAETNRMGFSYGFSSQWRANKAARNKCGYKCRAAVQFQNACGALAVGRVYSYGRGRNVYAGRWSGSLSKARSLARSACYRMGGRSCYIKKSLCSRGQAGRNPVRPGYSGSPVRPGHRRNKYAAIAVNPNSHRYRSAISHSSKWDAANKARRYCGKGACRTIVRVQNGCAALAWGVSRYNQSRRIYTGGWAASRYRARANARSACYRKGGSRCRTVKTVCTR